jgi:hypothetical protein
MAFLQYLDGGSLITIACQETVVVTKVASEKSREEICERRERFEAMEWRA